MSESRTRMPYFCGRRTIFDRFKLGTIGLLCAILLSSCGESSPRGYVGSASSDTLTPISAPPGSDITPPLPGTTGAQKTPDGLPALSAMGLNTALFSEKLGSEDARMGRLENAVQELRNDFDAISPAVVRLVSIEKDIQNLIAQLEVLTNGPIPNNGIEPVDSQLLSDDAPIQPAPVPVPQPPENATNITNNSPPQDAIPEPAPILPETATQTTNPTVSPTPPPTTAATTTPAAPAPAKNVINVTNVRIGEHKGKIRMVLDVSGKSGFTADLDNSEKILVVELPQTGWNTDATRTFSKNPILDSYKTQSSSNNGTRLIIQLKSSSELLYKSSLSNPDGTTRIVIDLKTP